MIDYLWYLGLEKVISDMIAAHSQGVTTPMPVQLLSLLPIAYIWMGRVAILIS